MQPRVLSFSANDFSPTSPLEGIVQATRKIRGNHPRASDSVPYHRRQSRRLRGKQVSRALARPGTNEEGGKRRGYKDTHDYPAIRRKSISNVAGAATVPAPDIGDHYNSTSGGGGPSDVHISGPVLQFFSDMIAI
jgi:hypothetical protein